MKRRCRTFAERIGPKNARSILIHYVGILALAYAIFTIRSFVFHYQQSCQTLEKEASLPYWASIICFVSGSTNPFVAFLRLYLEVTTFYFTLAIALVKTITLLILSKHIYRALRMDAVSKRVGGVSGDCKKDKHWVAIDMEVENTTGMGCIEDSFVIELILATLNFFNVSETKDD